jgi:hypothetical protein
VVAELRRDVVVGTPAAITAECCFARKAHSGAGALEARVTDAMHLDGCDPNPQPECAYEPSRIARYQSRRPGTPPLMACASSRPIEAIQRLFVAGVGVAVVLCVAPTANARAATSWTRCSPARGNAAAHDAGLVRALNSDPILKRVFSGERPSDTYRRPSTSLCGDFDRDGIADRAVHYQCCTVSSPAPWVVLRRRGSRWRIGFRRLHDTTFKLEGDGANLVTTEPKYAPTDALCCPSQLRIGTLRWTGTAFKRSFRIEDT